MAPRYNEPRYNEDPVITNNIWKPGRITIKYVEMSPADNEPHYNEILAITNRFWRSQRTIYPTLTNIFADNQIIRFNGVFAITKTPL